MADAASFATTAYHLSSRLAANATSSVAWSPGPWTVIGEQHQTSDLSSIVEEIVGQGGWTSGNSLVFFITGSGERTATSYNEDPANAPQLTVSYTVP